MQNDKQEYKRILSAVDGSESAEYALMKAIKIALRNHSELIITHAIDTHVYTMGEPALYFDDIDFDTSEIEKKLAEYKHRAASAGVEKVTIDLTKGNPKTVLSKELPRKYHADLIVVGQTGLNAIERWMVGSVSEQIIRAAPCDVLIVRNEEENEE